MSMQRFWKWQYIVPAAIVGAPVVIALFVFVAGGLVMLLWNWLLPPLLGVPAITLLQGFGLLALCRILFGGRGGGGGGGYKRMRRKDRDRVRHRMDERFGCARVADAPPAAGGTPPALGGTAGPAGPGPV